MIQLFNGGELYGALIEPVGGGGRVTDKHPQAAERHFNLLLERKPSRDGHKNKLNKNKCI